MTIPRSNGSSSRRVQATSTPRFDLQGKPIPPELAETLSSHLGLHHHAGSRAGYTLADLLHLAQSTVPAQRTTMLGVLTNVMRHLAGGELDKYDLGGTREQVRERILEAAIPALGEHGSLGVRAVDVVWKAWWAGTKKYYPYLESG